MSFAELAAQLAEIGRDCYARGGANKATLSAAQIVEIDGHGKVVAGSGRPSAEASLHLASMRARGAGAVLHTHSIWSTILSEAAIEDGLAIEGYEMLKGLDGVDTHQHHEWLALRVILPPVTQVGALTSRRPLRRAAGISRTFPASGDARLLPPVCQLQLPT